MRIVVFSAFMVMPFYWLCLFNHVFVVSGLCLDDQRSLLLQLKNNITLPWAYRSSSRLKSWNASDDCCRWMGVTCDTEGHVTALDLSGESISGGFDDSSVIFSLQHLQELNLASNNFNSIIPSGFNKLDKLTYLNLSYAGFVGQIPIEISQLTRLVTLDISCLSYLTGQELKLENPNLQKLVQNLTSIRQLYLDGVSIKVPGHEWCSAFLLLRDLQELSMSHCNLSGPLDPSLATLKNLSVIVLDQNNLSSPVPDTFSHLKNLTILSLVYCGLHGTFPQGIFSIGSLSVIDISFNYNLQGVFPDFPRNSSLQILRVSNTSFSGAFPNSIGNMRNLFELDFSYCQFNGTLPNSLSNLTELSYLDLSFNNFTGQMPSLGRAKNLTHLDLSHNGLSGAIPSSHFEGLDNLVSIGLGYNSINGSIPSSLFTLTRLQRILLSHNQFGQLDEVTNVSSSKLNTLDLSSNRLSGSFPTFILQLEALSILQLSSNKFNGSMHLDNILVLRNLTTLDLSYNNLSVKVNVTNVSSSSFPSIINLILASCNLKTFPGFLRNQSRLATLDLSDNHIQGTVPNWIWKLQILESLNISHNLLTHFEGPFQNLSSHLLYLDLHQNKLPGPVPVFPRNMLYFDLSSNKFSSIIPRDFGNYMSFTFFLSLSNNTLSGSIPDSLCNALYLKVLDLSNNNISGTIPSCLMMTSGTLEVLNLKNNNLSSPIPNTVTVSCGLWTLNLHGNQLDGPIPKSLTYCSKLEVLDLGSNQITGGFPCFLKEIPRLRVLVLRNNKFQGSPKCLKVNMTWEMLQIVDIAFNNFSGKLPREYFTTWKRNIKGNKEEAGLKFIEKQITSFGSGLYYRDSITVISKGQKMELVKILTIFTSIDFSSNHFDGPIPEELMDWKELHVLNLSNNALSGKIPSSIGNMRQLESLDLSQNSLSGEIPVQLASLSFLSYLNLSFNHLMGKIPTSTQLQSFPASSFEGNDGLDGPPLTKNPDHKEQEVLPQQECGRLACTIDWNFISVELGLIFGHGVIFGPLLIWKQWRLWYWQLVHKILCQIFPQVYLEYATWRGHTYEALRWMH
ncbi:hypothetical protein AAZX31_03G046600 [Glycine max]